MYLKFKKYRIYIDLRLVGSRALETSILNRTETEKSLSPGHQTALRPVSVLDIRAPTEASKTFGHPTKSQIQSIFGDFLAPFFELFHKKSKFRAKVQS